MWGVNGRWYHDRTSRVMWTGEVASDPYNDLSFRKEDFENAGFDFDKATYNTEPGCKLVGPKEIIDILGDDYVSEGSTLSFVDAVEIQKVHNNASIVDALGFLKSLGIPEFLVMISRMAIEEHSLDGCKVVVCLQPGCHLSGAVDENATIHSDKSCRMCGTRSLALASNLTGVSDAQKQLMDFIQSETDSRGHEVITMLLRGYTKEKRALDVVDMFPEALSISVARGCGVVINPDAPQIRVKGPHFIKGQANREVLINYGWVLLGTALRTEVANLVGPLRRVTIEMFSEDKIYDPSVAKKFRAEYIQSNFESEIYHFELTLRNRGVLKALDPSLRETTEALYNMAQWKTGRKTIIKRDGTIVFPTKQVLETIDTSLMTKAFMATEHWGFNDPSDVFRLGKETACD